MTMTFDRFMSQMLRPTYVIRMAHGKLSRTDAMGRGARTSFDRAQREIDDLVLQRALAIQDERRCAAVSRGDTRARCEFHRDHGPVGPGIADTRVSHITARIDWDHGAPKQGVWWKENPLHSLEVKA